MKAPRRCCLAAVFACATALAPAAVNPTAWESRQTLTLPAAGPVRLNLPAELLDAARPDLADLRLLSPDGNEVPFVLLRPAAPAPVRSTLPVQPRLEGQRTVILFTVAEPMTLTQLRLVTPAPAFVKAMTIAARNEDGDWQTLAREAVVFRTRSGPENPGVALPPATAREFRVELDDTRESAIPVTAVALEALAFPVAPPRTQPLLITSIDHTATESRVRLDFGLRHLPLAHLTVAVRDVAFERRVRLVVRTLAHDEVMEHVLAQGRIRRIALPDDVVFSDLTFEARVFTPAAALELVVDNGDSPPLTFTDVTAGFDAVAVAFQAPAAGTYTMLAGNQHAVAPRYDVEAFAEPWRKLPTTVAAFGAFESNPAFQPTEPPVLVPERAGPFDATGWSTQRAVIIASPGAQVLELDPAALAGAQPDLADVRLARDGYQVPYLLERAADQRTLPLEIVEAPDAERPELGRWRIDLPHPGVPATQLLFRIREPLFSRVAHVFEIVDDRRGQPMPRRLGTATWTRGNAADAQRFSVPLETRPVTSRLFLEIDHGDNQPFTPIAVEATHPIRRLRFRASTPGEITLHYGNADARAPHYDLALAAPLLLAAREHPAQLRAADATATDSGRDGFSLGGRGATVAFWSALGLVVVVLIWLVARLLPKPPPEAGS